MPSYKLIQDSIKWTRNYCVFNVDEHRDLCSRGPGFGPGPTGPDAAGFITGQLRHL